MHLAMVCWSILTPWFTVPALGAGPSGVQSGVLSDVSFVMDLL